MFGCRPCDALRFASGWVVGFDSGESVFLLASRAWIQERFLIGISFLSPLWREDKGEGHRRRKLFHRLNLSDNIIAR